MDSDTENTDFLDSEGEEQILTDAQCVAVLDRFLRQSWGRGHIDMKEDFKDLAQSVYRAISWYHELHTPAGIWLPVEVEKCELEGPYECPSCGFHVMLDATFLYQVEDLCKCPNCGYISRVPEED